MGRMEEWKISSHATLKSHSSGADDWSAVTLETCCSSGADDWSAVTLETCCSSGAEESGYRCSIDIALLWSGERAC